MLTCQEWRDSSDKKTDYLITKLGFARGIDVAVSIDKAGKTLRDAWVLLQGSNDR